METFSKSSLDNSVMHARHEISPQSNKFRISISNFIYFFLLYISLQLFNSDLDVFKDEITS